MSKNIRSSQIRTRKAKKGFINIPVEIYNLNVVICVNKSRKEIEELGIKLGIQACRFTNEWGISFEEAARSSHGFITDFGEKNRDILVWLKEAPCLVNLCLGASNSDTLYHELYHVVERIASDVDGNSRLENGDGTSEARAYLFGYLVREAHKYFFEDKK